MIRGFVDARLLNGTGAPVRAGMTVVVDGARIVEVSEAREFGSESGLEPALMVEYGLTPEQSLVATTSAAARCMGIDKLVGTIEPGKEADLLVVDGDPLVDPGVVGRRERIHLVMKAGCAEAGPLVRELTPEPAGPVRYWL